MGLRFTIPPSRRAAVICSVLALCAPLADAWLIGGAGTAARAVPAAKQRTGEQVYKQLCVSCHGTTGQGTESYTKPLIGDKSIGELAHFIAQSMPPGAPKKLPQADAASVAAYIHGAFYSPLARARNKPARVELSRLTVRQYRNTVADLIGSFRSAPQPQDERRGLRAEYFKVGDFRNDARVLQRVDPEIHFDYGAAGPDPATQTDPYQFAMRWQGSVVAPDTGEYEFIVRSEHAVRLWINDSVKPLIDASVKSGSDNEYHATLFLLGGRAYPLRLEFSKGVQGVNNLAKVKAKPPLKASLSLEWKMPKQSVAEVIPQRCLLPTDSPETFVSTTPFPPDDRSVGYERGTSVSRAWADAATEAAVETAGYVSGHLRVLSGVPDDAPDRKDRLREFCRRFVERALRRPLTDAQARFFVDRQVLNATDIETGVKRVVLLTLNSPQFLYRELPTAGIISPGASPDPYDVASRLSFALWDSLPDGALLKAAASGQLATRDQVAVQADRMAADPRAWFKLREFFLKWFKVDSYPDLAKDPKRYPGFDATAALDLRTSLDLFLENEVWSDKSDYRDLFLTDKVFLNGRLAKIYGAPLAADASYQPVALDPGKRAGVLTQPYLLASFAYVDNSSPIHRGVLIARNLLGRALLPPPQAFAPLAASLHPNLTTRQRVSLQTKPAACSTCHSMINPLGFTLEKFDAIGRLRATENGSPIDATGSYRTRSGQEVRFADARDLSRFLADSPEAHAAFVEQLFQHVVKQPVRAYGPDALGNLEQSFSANQYNIRKQMIASATLAALKK